jgi:glycosyltransferase involved in cell wall biosynthesis
VIEAPVFDVCGYASVARSLITGLGEAGFPAALAPRWFKGSVHIDPHGAGTSDRPTITLRDETGQFCEYALWLSVEEVNALLPWVCEPVGGDTLVVGLAPHSGGLDHFAIARRANPNFGSYVGSTMFEADRISKSWVRACNGMDAVWVPSEFNLESFTSSGVDPKRLHKVPLGVDVNQCRPGLYAHRQDPLDRVVFLSVFEWDIRKGWDVLLRAFCSAFSRSDPVVLQIRSNHPKGKPLKPLMDRFLADAGFVSSRLPEIELLEQRMDRPALLSFYDACDAFVLPSRGEGWGMPYLEAMAFGKPAIGTAWGGNTEFMNEENSFLIESEGLVDVSQEQLADNSCFELGQRYAQPSVEHLAQILTRVASDVGLRRRVAERGLHEARTKWSHVAHARSALRALNLDEGECDVAAEA